MHATPGSRSLASDGGDAPVPAPRPRLVVVGPLPPPHHGVTVSTSLVLANARLRAAFDVEHLDTSDHRSIANINSWDVRNVAEALGSIARLARRLRGRRGTLYLPISQNRPGFLRDSLFVHVAKARGWSVAIHLRGSEFPQFYRAMDPPFRWWIRRTLAGVDGFGVMGRSLRTVFGPSASPDRVAVVPNGTPDPGCLARPEDSRLVVVLGNMLPRKGTREAVEAARLVLERVPDAQFTFVGGSQLPAFEAELRALAAPAGARISFCGPIIGSEKERLLASAGLLLFCPVEPEGHPRVVLEACAAGLPVVATDRGAIADTVQDGVNGYVLPDPDPPLVATRVARLLEDPALREAMGRASRRRYEECFTQERADERLTAWLTAVASAGVTGRRAQQPVAADVPQVEGGRRDVEQRESGGPA